MTPYVKKMLDEQVAILESRLTAQQRAICEQYSLREQQASATDVDRRWWRNQQAEAAQAKPTHYHDFLRIDSVCSCGLTAKEWLEDAPVSNGTVRSFKPEPAKPEPPRPVCACGQTVWNGAQGYDGTAMCSDCSGVYAASCFGLPREELDARIAAVRTEPAEADVGPWSADDAEYVL